MRALYRAVPHLRERSGRRDIGIMVASQTGVARIEGPRRQLLSFLRDASRVRVQDTMLVHAIAPRDRAGALRAAAAGPR